MTMPPPDATTSAGAQHLGRGAGQMLTAHPMDHRVDPQRLASIARLGLLDQVRDAVFDRASRLASRLLGTELALVSIVTDEAQHFVGGSGLAELLPDIEQSRRTPLTHSFCQYVVRDRTALVVPDAQDHPTVAGNLAIDDLGVHAYLGVPVRDGEGRTLGALCVIERNPREWTEHDREVLEELGGLVHTELLLRGQLQRFADTTRAQEEFLATTAHDLRASVGGIAGAARTLGAGRAIDPESQDEMVALMVRQSERAVALLAQMLDRKDAAAPTMRPTELHTATRAAADTAAASLDDWDRLEVSLNEIRLVTDRDTLERIVLNLVRNALQHTDGPVEVRTGVDRELGVVLVRDHGQGLPDWILHGDLGSAALRGRAKGHGIGLFSAVTLARSIGGRITVESSDRGTSARLLVPLDVQP